MWHFAPPPPSLAEPPAPVTTSVIDGQSGQRFDGRREEDEEADGDVDGGGCGWPWCGVARVEERTESAFKTSASPSNVAAWFTMDMEATIACGGSQDNLSWLEVVWCGGGFRCGGDD
ncbi:hypothetical protein E3N88_29929 [Mikania micrantha]|uniref:Uncharacterized protein n=1 Tax=Mikania micrantha TaxID=192012 RepID=A0A5N6MKU9_9ASTR|nr:hypothetical protein E3N88_29929 [Mikania micrantha]